MIRNFADKGTERLFHGESVAKFQAFERIAYRHLTFLDAAESLHDLRGPGHQLEKLKRDKAGQHAIRINDAYRICFVWKDGHAENVYIENYH